jgi:hypothetical protein
MTAIELIIPRKKPVLTAGMRVNVPVYMTGALDPAASSKVKSDASGITVCGTDPADNRWVLEADPFRGQPDAVAAQCCMYIVRYQIKKFSIEQIAFSYLFADLLRPLVKAAGVDCQIVPYTEAQRFTKHTRILRLEPRLRQGKLRIAAHLARLKYEMENYAGPGSLDHEDLIDSLAQHEEIARPADPTEVVTFTYEEEIPPSKRGERARFTNDRLDGTFTGGR